MFAPQVADLYPPPTGRSASRPARSGSVLEGAARPGHFDGVLTVVLKLFHIVVRPRCRDLRAEGRPAARLHPADGARPQPATIEIVGAPIIREPDGLALSSRNVYLSPEERRRALALSAALAAGARHSGATASQAAARAVLAGAESDPSFSLDYLALVSPDTFTAVADTFAGEALMIVAATIGSTRLIDNATVTLTEPEATGALADAETASAGGGRQSWDRTTATAGG